MIHSFEKMQLRRSVAVYINNYSSLVFYSHVYFSILPLTLKLFYHTIMKAERDRQEKERIINEERWKEEAAERDRQEKERLSVEAVAQVSCSSPI